MRSHETLMEVGRDSRLAPSGSANMEAKTHDLPQEYELAFAGGSFEINPSADHWRGCRLMHGTCLDRCRVKGRVPRNYLSYRAYPGQMGPEKLGAIF